MAYSRISRLEEKRTKQQLIFVLIGIVVVIILAVTVGIPLMVGTSVFVGNLKSKQPIADAGDKTPPFPPVLSAINSATNSATLKVEGYSEPASTLKLFVNGSEAKNVLLGNDGSFSFADINLAAGDNTLYATSTDTSGNESTHSAELTISYKKEAPKLDVSDPQDHQSFGKNNQDIIVRGTTDPGVNVWINDRFVQVKTDGTFVFSVHLNDGDNTLKIVAQDPAGNQTKLERTVTFNPNS